MKRRTAFISAVALAIAATALAGSGIARTEADAGSDPLARVAGYHAWYKANPEPYRIAPAVNVLCAAPVAPGETAGNPHENAYVDVYVNEVGRPAMAAGGASVFPEGSVIVKEKRKAVDDPTPTLLTVMIKRAKGFDPAVGDWEFAVLDGGATTVQAMGRLTNCARCHTTVAGSDYVFRSYIPKSS